MHLAAIDIGSNAIRLLIKQAEGVEWIYNPRIRIGRDYFERLDVRLGLDVYTDGHISPKREQMLTQACRRYRVIMASFHVTDYRACATAAFRAATNAGEVTERIREATGINIETISGEEEVRLVMQSYLAQTENLKDSVLFVDVGGGSTDIALNVNGDMVYVRSFPIGSMRIACKEDVHSVADSLTSDLKNLASQYGPFRILGSGGSIHTIAKKFTRKGRVNYVAKASLETLCHDLNGLSVEEKMERYHLARDRAEIVVEAAQILLLVLNATQATGISAPAMGLRDGIIVDLIKKHQAQKEA